MKPIESFADLTHLFARQAKPKHVVVVCPSDQSTMDVVERCLEHHLNQFTLVCRQLNEWVDNIATRYAEKVTIIPADNTDHAAQLAVAEIRAGRGDVLMKGDINTDNLLRAVLNKELGLLPEGRVLTHITAAETPAYNKLIFFSDAAVIPRPTLDQLDAMVRYDVDIVKRLGITHPKVALIHFSEKTNQKFEHTIFYQQLRMRADKGEYGLHVSIDGPMDVKTACDAHSAEVKHIESDVTGHADILIFPNLEAGNTFYKTISLFGQATMAGMLCGADVPVVIPSRADNALSKFYSLTLACIAG